MKDNGTHLHITIEDMLKYRDGMADRAFRDQVDEALASCDECLAVFMTALEAEDSHRDDVREPWNAFVWPPAMPEMEKLEDKVIAGLLYEVEEAGEAEEQRESGDYTEVGTELNNSGSSSVRKPVKRRTWLQHPVTHYAIAASVTLMLLASGAFAGLSEKLRELEMEAGSVPIYEAVHEWQEDQESSWSERMLSRTGGWFDRIQSARFQ